MLRYGKSGSPGTRRGERDDRRAKSLRQMAKTVCSPEDSEAKWTCPGVPWKDLPFSWLTRHPIASIALLTPAVLLVHGYHPLADDGAVYVTGIKKLANPSLYQSDAVFALSPTHLSIFAHVLAPLLLHWGFLPALLLVCHVASIFLFLLGSWSVAIRIFSTPRSCWGAVVLAGPLHSSGCGHVAFHHGSVRYGALLFHAAQPFRVAAVLDENWAKCFLWLALAALLHPLMAAYAAISMLSRLRLPGETSGGLWARSSERGGC